MMPGNVFRLQLAAAFGDRRRTALRIAITTLLAMPFILVDMPARVQAAGIVMVILFTGFFGAAVGHARLRGDQRLARLTLLPTSRGVLLLDLAAASLLARAAPTVVVLAGFAVIKGRGVTPGTLIVLVGWLCSSLAFLTLLGMGTGRLARNNAEVHLFGALACAILAFVSGVTPLPERLAPLMAITAFNPISRMHTALIGLAAGAGPVMPAELLLASLTLGAVAVTAVLRWVLGGMRKTKGFDAPDVVVDNRAP
jgi:hypothetical protein